MKRLFGLFLCCFCFVGYGNVARADDIADVIVFQYGGKDYYYDNIDELRGVFERLIMAEPCLQNQDGLTVDMMFGALIDVCRQRRGTLDDLLRKQYGVAPSVSPTLGRWGVDNMWDDRKSKENSLRACIVDISTLAQDLKKLTRDKVVLSVGTDLDACVNSIKVDPNIYTFGLGGVYYGDKPVKRHIADTHFFCPLDVVVESEADLANVRNLNQEYTGKKFTFMDEYVKQAEGQEKSSADMKADTVMVFNGSMLVMCQGGHAVQMGRPVYSGYDGCLGGDSQDLPAYGSLPDGVYLMNVGRNVQNLDGNDDLAGFGKYRIPLKPSNESKTYGRNNFYLHGTYDPAKRRSSGCITLGVNIDEFIETEWFQNQIKSGNNILVIVKNQLNSAVDK